MGFPVAAALGLAGSALGSLGNIQMAKRQMRFQERMSSTAYQRSTQDLLAAGLNPMLAYQQGGASTPSGSTGEIRDPSQSALMAHRAKAEIGHINAQTDQASSAAALSREEAETVKQRRPFDVLGADLSTDESRSRRALMDQLFTHQRHLFPLVREHMGAEIELTLKRALESGSHRALMDAERILLEFQQNYARNMSNAQRTWFMRNVAPYLGSARDISRIATPPASVVGARYLGRAVKPLLRRP